MKKILVLLALGTGLSLQAAKNNGENGNGKNGNGNGAAKENGKSNGAVKTVTFLNENEKAKVMLNIYNNKTGEKLASKTLSAKDSLIGYESYVFNLKAGIDYAIEAKEVGVKKPLETGAYHLHVRKKDKKGTVKIIRYKPLIGKNDELSFVGNQEAEPEGAFVRKYIIQPDWARKEAKTNGKNNGNGNANGYGNGNGKE